MRSRKRFEVNLEELDQIIDRGQHAPLSESDGHKLKSALHALAETLVGTRSTEKTRKVLPPDPTAAEKPDAGKTTVSGHGRNGAAAFTGAHRVWIPHTMLHSGDRCPECRRGKLYLQPEPATRIRFVGQAPLEATVYEMERLRYNGCGQVFTAPEPEGSEFGKI
jgi:hypothetical protein